MGRILGLFKKNKSEVEYFLVLDIGTEFVKALIFGASVSQNKHLNDEQRRGIVIGFGRQRQASNQMKSGAVMDIDGVAATCRVAVEQAVQMAKVRPRRAIIGIAGEFVKGATTNFVYQRNDSKSQIDLAEIKNILQKIQWKAFDKFRRRFAQETGRPEIEIKLINALITEIRIDSYKVVNPLGFQGKEVFLSMFSVYAPAVHLRALETIASKLGLELISIAAEPYALARAVRSEYFNANADLDSVLASSAIFVDIGGGTTDVALVRYGGVEGIRSLALAGRSFTKRLSNDLGIGLMEAEEIKIKHAHQQLSDDAHTKIKTLLEKDIKVWLSGLELVLEEFNQKNFFPPLMLLCGGGSLLPDIQYALAENESRFMEKFPFSQAPRIDFVQPRHIANISDQTGFLSGSESVAPMALASLVLEILNDDKKTLLPTLRRVVKIMRR